MAAPCFAEPMTRERMVREAIWSATTPIDPRPQLRLAPTLSFRQWITRHHPRFIWYPHCEKWAAILQRVADGELTRVILLAPPRHGKSEIVSRLFPGYYLYRHPEQWIGLGSYGASLANKLSRSARDNARTGGVKLRDDVDSVQEWQTSEGGGLWSCGVGGAATGKGMHLGILDDPIKNAKEAASDVIGERNREWWMSTWYTRQEPGAALIVMLTRWPGPGDLVGWLFEQEKADEQPERWHVAAFEAEKTDEIPVVPPTCTVEEDNRAPGEALCPERYPLEKLRKIAARIGSFFFGSLFQQHSVHREGKMFRWVWWGELPATPVVTSLVRYWDLAGTEPKKKGHDPDYTASTLMGRMPDLRTAILDVTEFRESIGQRDAKIEQVAKTDRQTYGQAVVWWFEQEAGIGGEERMSALVRRIQALGLAVKVEPATGSKILRAEPLAAAAESGNVVLAPGPWWDRFRGHMAEFSATCAHDDIADAASGAFNKVSAPAGVWGSAKHGLY